MVKKSALTLEGFTPCCGDPHEVHRLVCITHATEYAAEEYRRVESHAYSRFDGLNGRYWGGRLVRRQIGFGKAPSRTVVAYSEKTPSGADGYILIHESFALAHKRNQDWVVRGHPAAGYGRAFDLVLLRGMSEQACWELPELRRQWDQGGSYPAVLTEERNRVGLMLCDGLQPVGPVQPRRRPADDEDVPVVTGWPFHDYDDDYFQGDVTPQLLSLLRGGRRRRRDEGAPILSLYDYFHRLSVAGKHDRLQSIFRFMRDRHEELRLGKLPHLRKLEGGDWDTDGQTPLPDVVIDPSWLEWGNFLLPGVVLGVVEDRRFDEVPVLADVLEDAGCKEPFLLRHLRHRMQHTRGCWALGKLAEASRQLPHLKEVLSAAGPETTEFELSLEDE